MDWTGPSSLVIAGPWPLPYADLVRAVAQAAGLPPPRIVPLPATPLMAAAAIARIVPCLPRIGPAELRRLLEDKSFDIAPMIGMLGVRPIGLAEGLRRTFTA